MKWLCAAATSLLLTGCITSLRDLGGSVDKTPVDSPVFETTPNIMFETCAKVLEEDDYKVTKADRKSGTIVGEDVLPACQDSEGTRVTVTMRLEKKGTGSIVHIAAIKEINTNIEDPLDNKNAHWKESERATDAETKLIFKLRHRLSNEAMEAADEYRKRTEKITPARKEMTEPLNTDRWAESCSFHTDTATVYAAVKNALRGYDILGEDAKSGRLETVWKESPGVDGHELRKKVYVRIEQTRYDVIVKLMVKMEMTSDSVNPKNAGQATWESIGYDEEIERKILLELTRCMKG